MGIQAGGYVLGWDSISEFLDGIIAIAAIVAAEEAEERAGEAGG